MNRTVFTSVPRFFQLLALAALSSPAWAEDPREDQGKQQASPRVTRPTGERPEDPKKRWQDLRPQEREKLSRLFEQVKGLGPEAKKRILERLRTAAPEERREVLHRVKEQLEKPPEERAIDRSRRGFVQAHLKSLSPEEREAFRKLSPAEKKDFLGKGLSEARKRQISRLPPALRQKVEEMKPDEQIHALQRFRAERLLKDTFQDPDELSKLKSLPRKQLLDSLRASLSSRETQRPECISEATWKRWTALRPAEKALTLRQLAGQPAAHRSPPGPSVGPPGR